MAFEAPASPRFHVAWRLGLGLALAASAVVALLGARSILSAPPVWNDQPLAWGRVAAIAAASFAAVVLRFRSHAPQAAWAAALAAAAILIGPGPVACVALLILVAWVIGSAVIGWIDEASDLPVTVVTLVGVAVCIGVLEATIRWRIHFAPVHVALAILVVAAGYRHVVSGALRVRRAWLAPVGTTVTERGWIVLAGVVATIHIVVVAKPEVGYDASTMHLQFAEIVAAHGAFREGVDRYLWSTMPLGADYAFATAFLVGGQAAARAINLAFGVIACLIVHRIASTAASREPALAVTVLFASMPLATLVTGSLFSETLWVALLLATLFVATSVPRRSSWLPILALLAGGAMATKVIGVLWLAPLALFAGIPALRNPPPRPSPRAAALIVLGLAIGAWPYASAWIKTGNPVFPFMNAVFRSPYVDSATSFNNPAYNAPLVPTTPWQLVLDSSRYIEGRDGALGLGWLLAFPLLVACFSRPRAAAVWIGAGVAVVFFIGVYTQQSYLRYLLPAFAAAAALSAVALGEYYASRAARLVVLVVGIALVAFDVRNVAAAHYVNATPCTRCLSDSAARDRYVLVYAPLRVVAQRLNRELPDAVVGFMLPNEAAPSGYVGRSRAGNWHDDAFFRGLVRAPSPEALLELARRHQLTHVVYRAKPDAAVPAIAPFAQRHTEPLWQVGDYVVASVRSSEAR